MASPTPENVSWENWRQSLASMTREEKARYRRELFRRATELDDLDAELLLTAWELWARPNQLHPTGEWAHWLVLAGRGFGKTRAGAEWVRESAKVFGRVNLIGKDATDRRKPTDERAMRASSRC